MVRKKGTIGGSFKIKTISVGDRDTVTRRSDGGSHELERG